MLSCALQSVEDAQLTFPALRVKQQHCSYFTDGETEAKDNKCLGRNQTSQLAASAQHRRLITQNKPSGHLLIHSQCEPGEKMSSPLVTLSHVGSALGFSKPECFTELPAEVTSDGSSQKQPETRAGSSIPNKLVPSIASDVNCQREVDEFGHNKAWEEGELHAFGSISSFNCSFLLIHRDDLCCSHPSAQSAGALLRFSSDALSRKPQQSHGKPMPEIESCATHSI